MLLHRTVGQIRFSEQVSQSIIIGLRGSQAVDQAKSHRSRRSPDQPGTVQRSLELRSGRQTRHMQAACTQAGTIWFTDGMAGQTVGGRRKPFWWHCRKAVRQHLLTAQAGLQTKFHLQKFGSILMPTDSKSVSKSHFRFPVTTQTVQVLAFEFNPVAQTTRWNECLQSDSLIDADRIHHKQSRKQSCF